MNKNGIIYMNDIERMHLIMVYVVVIPIHI